MRDTYLCGYCNTHSIPTEESSDYGHKKIWTEKSEHGNIGLSYAALACPNPKCKKLTLNISLIRLAFNRLSHEHEPVKLDGSIESWKLLPDSLAKPQPEYIPKQIREDYQEAAKILNLSPKASAALSRRCLQGIIRDYWKLDESKYNTLHAEIESIKDKVDLKTWQAIDAVRQVGNIGAHMEKDVSLIIDISSKEADALIRLIEILLEDWYVASHQRERHLEDVIKIAADKKKAKKNKTATE